MVLRVDAVVAQDGISGVSEDMGGHAPRRPHDAERRCSTGRCLQEKDACGGLGRGMLLVEAEGLRRLKGVGLEVKDMDDPLCVADGGEPTCGVGARECSLGLVLMAGDAPPGGRFP